jgi:hypothetical protein
LLDFGETEPGIDEIVIDLACSDLIPQKNDVFQNFAVKLLVIRIFAMKEEKRIDEQRQIID